MPQSFDVLEKKFGVSATNPQHYLSPSWQPWTAAEFLQWEDGRFYGYRKWMKPPSPLLCLAIAFESRLTDAITIKGLTPELKYLFFLYSFERNSAEELAKLEKLKIAKEEKEKLLAKYRESLEWRLIATIKEAGGTYLRSRKLTGNKLDVTWSIDGRTIITKIDADTLRVKEAGICLSGDDEKFNLKSLVLITGKISDRELHITRV